MATNALPREAWASRLTFILAATGSAVGLGNIWKFPYITGENGGGAFVLVYLACILLAGIPVMMAEVFMGKRARTSPVIAVVKPIWLALSKAAATTSPLRKVMPSYFSIF